MTIFQKYILFSLILYVYTLYFKKFHLKKCLKLKKKSFKDLLLN